MQTEDTGVPDDRTTESLMKQSKRRLAETIQAQCRLAELRNYAWATAVWQADLLAAQRQKVLDLLSADETAHPCSETELCWTCRLSDQIYDIIIHDPREAPDGSGGQAVVAGADGPPPPA